MMKLGNISLEKNLIAEIILHIEIFAIIFDDWYG
jgi:hypothetical protein